MDLHKAKYLLPNALTLSSAFAGFNSIYLSLTGSTTHEYSIAAWLIVIAMACDALDGRVARMTRAESELGVQLDSLADALSFGIAPAFLLYAWGLSPLGMLGMIIAFVYAASAILRLARYNVMAHEHDGVMRYFLGLPAPLAACAVVSVVMAHLAVTERATTHAYVSVAGLSVVLGGLMISNIKYRTFKDVNFRGRAGLGLVVLAGVSVALGRAFKPSVAFVALMVVYILVGLVGTVVHWSRAIIGDDFTPYDDFEDELVAQEEENG